MQNVRSLLLCHLMAYFWLVAGNELSADAPNIADAAVVDAATKQRLQELDEYWNRVSRAVQQGDFDAYQATCHASGILVSGKKSFSQPLKTALARWKQEFTDTKNGELRAQVEFRFSKRMGDATTAHETGIFRYESQRKGEKPEVEYIHLEALLLKENGHWRIIMEHQRESSNEQEWHALKSGAFHP